MKRNRLRALGCVLALLLCGIPVSARAANQLPWETAESIRRALYEAQKALLADDRAGAAEQVAAASTAYRQMLAQPITDAASQIDAALQTGFAAALDAARGGQAAALAAERGYLWAELLHGAAEVVIHALERGDGQTARDWLMVREFRSSRRFTRPGADATLAVNGFVEGKRSQSDALTAVRNDLLDTYQARLNDALADAELAQKRGFAAKWAETAALAAGYFDILGASYAAQRNSEALAQVQADFRALTEAAVAGDAERYAAAYGRVAERLKGFRAAPLSESEQARRAGQLLRFIALVPVEYERGVRDGRVINDIEIQEALTFRDGAAAAFADLQPALAARDAAQTDNVAMLLRQADAQIRATADPAALQRTVDDISAALNVLLPESWRTLNSGSDVDVIRSVLDQVGAAVKASQYAQAESARLEAYALLDSGVEQKLRGFAPDLAVYVEGLFWQGTAERPGLAVLLAEQAPAAEVNRTLAALRAALTEAETILGGKSAPAAVAGNAAVIVFREGLEAVLILASLLASLRIVEHRRFRRPIVAGAVLAFFASGVTWWIANGLLMSLIRFGERLEAVVSLIAIGVLLLITNWFFHKVYWTGWMANFHARKGRLIVDGLALGQIGGLVVLGFTSIYREGFETVLFLQSLVLDAGSGVVLQGVVIGLVGVGVVGLVTFALQVRLPYKKMLIATGILIGAVLLMMVGNTVHVMQAVGWLPITPISGLYLPHWMGQWFGVYATWQGIGLQIAAAVFVIGSYFWAEHLNHRKRARPTRQPTTARQAP